MKEDKTCRQPSVDAFDLKTCLLFWVDALHVEHITPLTVFSQAGFLSPGMLCSTIFYALFVSPLNRLYVRPNVFSSAPNTML